MIVYENTDHQFDASSYDETYAVDRQHFTHRSTFEALDTLFTEHLKIDRPLTCLDLGCGQGQVAARVRDIIAERAPSLLGDSQIYGLDLSPVAIGQCDESYPDLLWINDTLQDFLKRDQTKRELFGRFDLVINKGGLTFVTSEDEYDELLEGIHSLLGEGGRYLYIQNKKFYAKWCNRTCKGWGRDVFDIAGAHFGSPRIVDNKGYFIDIYTKRPDSIDNDYQPAADEPLTIELFLNSGKTETWFVGGNELISPTIKRLTEHEPQTPSATFEVPPKMRPEDQVRHRELVAQTAEAAVTGGPTIVVPTHEIWQSDGRKAPLLPSLHSALSKRGLSPLHFPMNCVSTRQYCEVVNQWVAVKPDAILLGLGLEDYRRDPETDRPWLDLDEFAWRLEWLVWKLQRETEATIIWVWLSLDADLIVSKGARIYRASDSKIYQSRAETILRSAGVEPREIPLVESRSRWGRNQSIETRLAKLISDALQPVRAAR